MKTYAYHEAVAYGHERHPDALIECAAFDHADGPRWRGEVYNFSSTWEPRPPKRIAEYILPRAE